MTEVQYGDAGCLNLLDESVDCIVTSPPYGVGIEYQGYEDVNPETPPYQSMIRDATKEMWRVLKPSGRLWLNLMPAVPSKNVTTRTPLHVLWGDALDQCGLHYRDTVVWIQDSFDGSCGWGSWKRPSAPNLRGGYELILCYYKPPYKRTTPRGHIGYVDEMPDSTPWQDLVRNVWTINPSRRRPDAPAPFPEELVERCLRLSTWPGDVVLDPFAGSGTAIEVAERMGRVGIGYDIGAKS